MDMFLYMDKDTFIHKLDPRTKMIMLLFLFAALLIVSNLFVVTMIYVVIIGLLLFSRTIKNLKRVRVVLIAMLIIATTLQAIGNQSGEVIFGVFTTGGLYFGLLSALRLNGMIMAGIIFLSTSKIEDIALGLTKMKFPYKGAFVFSTAVRLVPMIVANAHIITQAQVSRGLNTEEGGIITKIKKFAPLMIPVFISLIRNINIFSMALESKGFGYSKERTELIEINLMFKDVLVMLLSALFLAFIILYPYYLPLFY